MEHSHLIQRDSDESEDESDRGGLQLLFGLQLNIQKTKIIASSPNTLWQIEGGKVEAFTDHMVKAVVFPVVMYTCETWVPKNCKER